MNKRLYIKHKINCNVNKLILDNLGLRGYGLYWLFLEKIQESELTPNLLQILTKELKEENSFIKTVLAFLIQNNIFKIIDGKIIDSTLEKENQEYSKLIKKRSLAGKISAKKRWHDKKKPNQRKKIQK